MPTPAAAPLALAALLLAAVPPAGAAGTDDKAPDVSACRAFTAQLIQAAKGKDVAALRAAFRDPADARLESAEGPTQLVRTLEMLEVTRCQPRLAGVAVMWVKLKPGQGPPERRGEELPFLAVREENGRLVALSRDELHYFADEREAPLLVEGVRSIPLRFNTRPPDELTWLHQEKHLWITAAGDAIRFGLRFDRPLTEIRPRPERYAGPHLELIVLFDADANPATGYWGPTFDGELDVPPYGYRLSEVRFPQYGAPGLDHALTIKGSPAGGKWEMTIAWQAIVREKSGHGFALEEKHRVAPSAIATSDGDLHFEIPARALGWHQGSRLIALAEPQRDLRVPVEYLIP